MKLEQIFSFLRVSKNGAATTNSTGLTGANLKSRASIIPNCPPVGHRKSRHSKRGLILLAMLTLGMLATGSKAFAQQLPFGTWSSATTYHTGDIIAKAGASATDLYKAVATSTNADPTTDDGSHWKFYEVYENWTLNVGTGKRFATLLDAWGFVDDSVIPDGYVTIQLDDGSYDLGSGLIITETCASRVKIIGNSTTPANVVLYVSTNTGSSQFPFFVGQGANLSLLDGVSLENHTSGKLGGNSPMLGVSGRCQIGNILINGYNSSPANHRGSPFGLYVYNGGSVIVASPITVSYCDTGFRAQGGSIEFDKSSGTAATADYCDISFAAAGGRIFSAPGIGATSSHAGTYDFWAISAGNICLPGSVHTFTPPAGILNLYSTIVS